MNPWALLAAIGLLCAAFWAGWVVHGWKYDAARTAALESAIKDQKADYANAVAAEAQRIAANREIEAKTETIIKTVTRYIHEDADYCGMRARAVRVFDAGRTGTELPAAAEPHGSGRAAPAP